MIIVVVLDNKIKFINNENYIYSCLQLIRDRIWSQKTVEIKSCEVDLVTETDQEVENLLISSLKSRYPEHKYVTISCRTIEGQTCNCIHCG